MSQLPVPGRDTAYVWIGRGVGGRPAPAGRLLRRAGAALLGRAEAEIVVERGRDGRPLVAVRGAGARLPVSVSRSGPVVVVAARAGGPVGVDVERCRPLPAAALARRWYAPAEAAWLVGRPADGQVTDFLRLWTAKEAVGKALGVGLRDGGLRRRMPVPVGAHASLRPVPGLARLRVGHPGVGVGLVLAVAVDDVGAAPVEVVVVEADGHVGAARHGGHVAAVRSASVERTSLPVVVRGN
ncbi:4'-phosphopantetheinyl transferase superfamily protein [Micromonospora echinofusca]|uniref:4'-phosphopantetheinyl transferase family protein n=1 Tax=Micromonospora echinofusca TaxID=47858 RepID=UPI000C70571B|nr:4'-phosphopantetheinyl transferase superfamily protein [Micromonospora sp. MSM11]MCL7457574.1 4'-phosphopantetheinyl transferase superfamily protein [Micromonospora sp. MSM11]